MGVGSRGSECKHVSWAGWTRTHTHGHGAGAGMRGGRSSLYGKCKSSRLWDPLGDVQGLGRTVVRISKRGLGRREWHMGVVSVVGIDVWQH